MSLKWQEIVTLSTLTEAVKTYLTSCLIRKVTVSQAENAWEIYFICPFEPKPEYLVSLTEFWQSQFGHQFQPIFHFETEKQDTALEHVCPNCCSAEDIEENYRHKLLVELEKANKGKETKNKKKQNIIFGKKIKEQPVSINTILEEERSVTICAYIFDLEYKVLKTGRTLISFIVSDKTDSLHCKIFADIEAIKDLQNGLQENNWYLLRGPVQTDRFSQELTLLAQDITDIDVPRREDLHPEKRVELHLHTKMSALDGVADAGEVVAQAARWGHPAVALTDHGVVQAFPDAYQAAQRHKIKLILGIEGYLFDDLRPETPTMKTPTYHCIILALNKKGLRNLYELVTLSHLQYFHRVPRIPKSRLSKLRDGLLVGSACEAGELIRCYVNEKADRQRLAEVAAFYDYLEIQPRGNNLFMLANGTFKSEADLLQMNTTIYELGKSLGKPVVATGDVHFLEPSDEVYRRILMAGKGFEDADKQAPLYLMTTEEMLTEFAYLGSEAASEVVIQNTQKIAALAETLKPIPDEFYPPEIPGAEEEIINLTMSQAHELYGTPLPEPVQQRLDKELKAIISNGFAVLYLIAHKLVKKSNDDGYLVGSRGSVGSSLVATLCGITEVNPLPPHYICPHCHNFMMFDQGTVNSGADLPMKECEQCGTTLIKNGHNILFEVFLGFAGDKVPDIDLNFSGDYQAAAHKYTEELFGRDNVFRAGTIATVANKTAFGFVKNYFAERNTFVRSAEINRLVNGCTGVKRTTGQHPGGIMVLPKGLDVHNFTPLQRPADDTQTQTVTTHFDYHAISSQLVKLDILGHDDPTVLRMLEDITGMDCRTIPLDEPRVLSLFRNTEALGVDPEELGTTRGTLGIPEFGTRFVRQMLEDTNPLSFSELVRISGFSHGTDVWSNNAQEIIKSGKARVSEVISARDDIMIYLMHKAVNPIKAFKIMEDVRKGKGLSLDDVRVLQEHEVPPWYIESCQKIKYLFPKAHAVAYVMMAFRIAWFKVYYPAAFYASFFTVRADEFDAEIVAAGDSTIKKMIEEITKKGKEATQKEEKLCTILEVAHEMYLRGITLKKVSLLASDNKRFIIRSEGKSLLPPLVSLQGLGQTAAAGIVRAREKKPFTSREDLRMRAKLSKTVIEVLDKHGCLDNLPENDQLSLF
jgi:DNA polymerase-3 subunit alpha (Gram-positive type)